MFELQIPMVYQVELVGGLCNLKCVKCPVTGGKVKRRQKFFNVDFFDVMYERGDFENTCFLELQMYGEPLLHPDFDKAVKKIKSYGIKVGLSTNGTIWKDGLKDVDFITVSADSTEYRQGRDDKKFYKNLEKILSKCKHVDVQIIKIFDWEQQLEVIKEICKSYDVVVRTIDDCFGGQRKKGEGICLNPFLSVSIQSDGDVVPCCLMYDKGFVYGNVYNKSLKEIWNSEPRSCFSRLWQCGGVPAVCEYCDKRSPALLHYQFWCNWVKKGWV